MKAVVFIILSVISFDVLANWDPEIKDITDRNRKKAHGGVERVREDNHCMKYTRVYKKFYKQAYLNAANYYKSASARDCNKDRNLCHEIRRKMAKDLHTIQSYSSAGKSNHQFEIRKNAETTVRREAQEYLFKNFTKRKMFKKCFLDNKKMINKDFSLNIQSSSRHCQVMSLRWKKSGLYGEYKFLREKASSLGSDVDVSYMKSSDFSEFNKPQFKEQRGSYKKAKALLEILKIAKINEPLKQKQSMKSLEFSAGQLSQKLAEMYKKKSESFDKLDDAGLLALFNEPANDRVVLPKSLQAPKAKESIKICQKIYKHREKVHSVRSNVLTLATLAVFPAAFTYVVVGSTVVDTSRDRGRMHLDRIAGKKTALAQAGGVAGRLALSAAFSARGFSKYSNKATEIIMGKGAHIGSPSMGAVSAAISKGRWETGRCLSRCNSKALQAIDKADQNARAVVKYVKGKMPKNIIKKAGQKATLAVYNQVAKSPLFKRTPVNTASARNIVKQTVGKSISKKAHTLANDFASKGLQNVVGASKNKGVRERVKSAIVEEGTQSGLQLVAEAAGKGHLSGVVSELTKRRRRRGGGSGASSIELRGTLGSNGTITSRYSPNRANSKGPEKGKGRRRTGKMKVGVRAIPAFRSRVRKSARLKVIPRRRPIARDAG